MVISVLLSTIIFYLGSEKNPNSPGRLQVFVEMSYDFMANMVRDNVGSGGKVFFLLFLHYFYLFYLEIFLGMVPYNFTYTSHIIVTFGLAGFIFLAVTLIGIIKHGVVF